MPWASPEHARKESGGGRGIGCKCRRKTRTRTRIRTRNEIKQLRIEFTPQTFSTAQGRKDYIQRDQRGQRSQRQTQAYYPSLLSLTSLLIFPVPILTRVSRSRCFYPLKPAVTALCGSQSLAHLYRLREQLHLRPYNTHSANPKSRHYRLTISVPVFPLPTSWYSTSPSRATRKCGWPAGTRYESPA